MTKTCVSIIFESDMSKMKEVLNDILGCMKNLFPFMSEDELLDIRLIYSELLANAVIHGNKKDSSKYVEMMIEVEEDEIFGIIKDQGRGFNYSVYEEMYPDNIMSDHGRGIYLVDSLTEELCFSEEGSVVEFRKKISGM